MLHHLFELIQAGGLSKVNLTLDFDSNDCPRVCIQAAPSNTPSLQKLNPSGDGSAQNAAKIYAALATPVVIKSESVEAVDTELAMILDQFCNSYTSNIQGNNLHQALNELNSAAKQKPADKPKKSATKTKAKANPASKQSNQPDLLASDVQPTKNATSNKQADKPEQQAEPVEPVTHAAPTEPPADPVQPQEDTKQDMKPDPQPEPAPAPIQSEPQQATVVDDANDGNEELDDFDDDLKGFFIC